MGRKGRHSAKTGDVALYRSRSEHDDDDDRADSKGDHRRHRGREIDDDDDDEMYDEVDRYHNRREVERQEFLRLGAGSSDGIDEESEDDGITRGKEGVFDLGVGDEDESSSEDDDEDDDKDEDKDERGSEEDESLGSSSSSSEESSDGSESESDVPDDRDLRGLRPDEDVLDWGGRKASYYHGDTADMEIGQDEEDAELEEEAGREVLRKRMEGMDETDFMLEDDGDFDDEEDEDEKMGETDDKEDERGGTGEREEKKKKKKGGVSSEALADKEEDDEGAEALQVGTRKSDRLAGLSRSDRRRLIDAAHPEFLPLVEHFRDGLVRELRDETNVACRALLGSASGGAGEGGLRLEDAEAVGSTPAGLKYLLTKALIQTSAALNVCQYLLLKSEAKGGRSAGSNQADGGEDDGDDGGAYIRSHPVIARLKDLNDLSDRLADSVESKVPDLREQMEGLVKAARLMEAEGGVGGRNDSDDSDGEEEEGESKASSDLDEADDGADDMEAEAAALADLGKRARETKGSNNSDEADEDESSEDEDRARRRAAAEARFALRPDDVRDDAASKRRGRWRRPAPAEDDYGEGSGEGEDEGEETARPGEKLARTVNAITQRADAAQKRRGANGSGPAPETADDENEERFRRGLELMEADIGVGSDSSGDGDDGVDGELDDDGDDDGGRFYARVKSKSAARKSAKKARYAVAPKYPNLDVVVEGERSIGRAIMKNRGLVAHKSKLNRNPRVKKREQYRRALVRRKGAVREVRTDEGHKYGGESTGVKMGISRSRKLGVR